MHAGGATQQGSGKCKRLLTNRSGGDENLARDRLRLRHPVDRVSERSVVAVGEGEGCGADRGGLHVGREERNRVEGRSGGAIKRAAICTRGGLWRRDG